MSFHSMQKMISLFLGMLMLAGGLMPTVGWAQRTTAKPKPLAPIVQPADHSRSLPVKPVAASQPLEASAQLKEALTLSLQLSDVETIEKQFDQAIGLIAKRLPSRAPVVIDLDETMVDNRAYFLQYGSYQEAAWEQWVLKAEAPAMPGAKAFVDFLEVHQVPYVFISGRREKWRQATELNLRRLHMAGYHSLLLKPNDYPGTASPRQFKSDQRCQVEKMLGQPIQLVIGDQKSDLEGACNGQSQVLLLNRLYILP